MKTTWSLILLIVMSVLSITVGVLGAIVGLFAMCFMFDAPGSERNTRLVAEFYAMISFPIACLLSVALSWLAYAFKWRKVACATALFPVAHVAVLAVLALAPWPQERYEMVQGEWSWVVPTYDGGVRVTKFGADTDTFVVLESGDWKFAKDKNRVYLQQYVIPGADPATFVHLKGPYGKDSSKIYCGTVPIQVTNPEKFEVVLCDSGREITYDKDHFVLFYGEAFANLEISQETPAFVGHAWARDGTSNYYGPARIEGADYATFTVIDGFSAKDAKRKYSGARSESD